MLNEFLHFFSKDYLEQCEYKDYVAKNIIPKIKLTNDSESIDKKIDRLITKNDEIEYNL